MMGMGMGSVAWELRRHFRPRLNLPAWVQKSAVHCARQDRRSAALWIKTRCDQPMPGDEIPSAAALGQCGQGVGRAHDADVAEGAEGEQIVVTGDDEIGGGGERTGEHGIIVGVARGGGYGEWFNQRDQGAVVGAHAATVLPTWRMRLANFSRPRTSASSSSNAAPVSK